MVEQWTRVLKFLYEYVTSAHGPLCLWLQTAHRECVKAGVTCRTGSNILVIPGTSRVASLLDLCPSLASLLLKGHAMEATGETKRRNKKLKGWKIDIPRDIKAILSILPPLPPEVKKWRMACILCHTFEMVLFTENCGWPVSSSCSEGDKQVELLFKSLQENSEVGKKLSFLVFILHIQQKSWLSIPVILQVNNSVYYIHLTRILAWGCLSLLFPYDTINQVLATWRQS